MLCVGCGSSDRGKQVQVKGSRYNSGCRQQFLAPQSKLQVQVSKHIQTFPTDCCCEQQGIFLWQYWILSRKDGGLPCAGESWRGCTWNCHEVPTQDLWTGDCCSQKSVFNFIPCSNQVVALKKVPLKRLEDGISEATIREIKALQQLESQFVVKWEKLSNSSASHFLIS